MQTAPVALSELLRLAFPGGSEFIGTPEQRSRVVQWADVINLPLHDEAEVEEDDLALLPIDATEPDLQEAITALSHADVAAVYLRQHFCFLRPRPPIGCIYSPVGGGQV